MRRRHFLLGTAAVAGATGARVVGWAALPARQRLSTRQPPTLAPGQVALNGWVRVAPDNTVTLTMAQAEMGQGVHTGLAMLLAEEMDADWARLRLAPASDDGIYNNQAAIVDGLPLSPDDQGLAARAARHVAGKLVRELPGMAGTGGSASIVDQWQPLREAGASARAMLVAAAAAQWQVPAAECRTEASRVLHAGSGRSASFGELAARAAQLPLPEKVRLKAPSQFRLIGQPLRRTDNAPKLDGSARYAIDAQPAGLLYAAARLCPTLGGKAARFDAAEALKLPGVRRAVLLPPVEGGLAGVGRTSGGVALIADAPHRAQRALDKLQIEWDHGPAAAVGSPALLDAMAQTLDTHEGTAHFTWGDAAHALATASRTIEAEYRVPMLAHATMEPMNCTVQFKDGEATVWAATQAQGLARSAVAKALGIGTERVNLIVPYLGGGFGRRYFTDILTQAALVAREADGAPVQLLWSREDDMAHDFYRPAYVSRHRAGFDAQGRLVAWQATTAGPGMGLPSFLQGIQQKGASDTGYAFVGEDRPGAGGRGPAGVRIAYHAHEAPLPLGIWRSVAHSQNAFFTESFVDEVASALGTDPVAFRLGMLESNPRMAHVLRRAALLSRWGEPLAPAADGAPQARGIALHRSFGSIVAQVAEVSVGLQGQIRVHRVVCVVDCGLAVNPNLVRQQIEGGLVFGLSAALHGEITLAKGQVQQSNFHDYAPLRMSECPAIETEIVESQTPPGGVGEVGTPPIAPAVANALFALTGRRLRSLPLRLT